MHTVKSDGLLRVDAGECGPVVSRWGCLFVRVCVDVHVHVPSRAEAGVQV